MKTGEKGGSLQRMAASDPYISAIIAGRDIRFSIERLSVCRIGRSPHSTIILDDQVASREHAMIRRDATGHCVVSDSGSRNGTLLNGRQLTTPTRLSDQDIIRIGNQELLFNQPEPATMVADLDSPLPTMVHLANSLISVMVADMRNYTVLSRELGEQRISALMSEIFREIGAVLFRNKSWSQKYIGDAVMAVWLHPGASVMPEELAVVIDTIAQINLIIEPMQQRFSLPRPLAFGAAINTGYAQIGNMGSTAIADFTALGDTVNKAFRLESSCKELGCEIVVGKSALDMLKPPIPDHMRPPMTHVSIKGYDAPETVYRLMFRDLPRLANLVMTSRDGSGPTTRDNTAL